MKVNNVSFGKWYRIPFPQLNKLSQEDALQLGVTIGNCKTTKSMYPGLSGFYVDIAPKKEEKFLKSCNNFKIKPTIENI